MPLRASLSGALFALLLGSGLPDPSLAATRAESPDAAIAPSRAIAPSPDERALLVVRVVDAATHEVIPARVRLAGHGYTPDPRLGPSHEASGALDSIATATGVARAPLAAGSYRVIASRGPEWSLATADVTLEPRHTRRIVLSLRRVVRSDEWVACDFHLHAAPSPDSRVSLEDRLASLAAEGVDFAVPTDHNRVVDYAPVARELGLDAIGTVPGVEVTTWAPEFGHFNAFPWTHDPTLPRGGAPEFEGREPASLLSDLHAHRGDTLVQVNHPRLEDSIGYFEQIGLDASRPADVPRGALGFDAIEVWNGYDLERLDRVESNLEEWMTLLRHGVRATATANSDSHHVHGQWAGYPRTYVHVPSGDPLDSAAVVRALREGRAFATSGPMLDLRVEGGRPGDTVHARRGRVRVRVRVTAPAWMDVSALELYAAGRLVWEDDLETRVARGARTVTRTATLAVRGPTFVVAVVRGERPMRELLSPRDALPFAFTNPVFVE